MVNEIVTLPEKDIRALVNQAESKFKDAIASLLVRRKTAMVDLLQWRHDVGKVSASIIGDKAKALHERTYGTHVVEDVANLLMEKKEVIYACGHFAAMYNDTDLKHMQEKIWPWRGIVSLLTIKDVKVRERFQKSWEVGKYKNTDELKNAIATYNAEATDTGVRTPTQGPTKSTMITSPVKTTDTIMTKCTSDTLPRFLKAMDITNSGEMDDKKREKIQAHIEHIRELIPPMKQLLVDSAKAIKDAGF